MEVERRTFTERRRGPDAVIKAVWWATGISWVLIIIALIITAEAQPKHENFIDRLYHVTVRSYWDRNLLSYVFYILLLNLATCIFGFILNMLRQKRKTDKISKSVIVLGLITLSGIIWYMIQAV
ncbi:MAG TPA: hypothetical protein VHT96_13755 [Clostridia bacterium]|nr:hypothetical protein [Clostridia bacterium]